MQNSRDKWSIFKHPSKPVITANEAVYWKDILSKTLKVGLEFEFNLKESKGNCKGKNQLCTCEHLNNSDCWKECLLVNVCKMSNCKNITNTCELEDCTTCEHFNNNKYECKNYLCSKFVSKCIACKDRVIDCEGCENKYDPNRNPDVFRENIKNNLAPSNSYGIVEGRGVHSITTDGSLLGKKGVEIITVGRRVNFWEFYDMAKSIIDISFANGAYTNERTSIHMHLLAGYFDKLVDGGMETGVPPKIRELEKDIPEIILSNFHQLCRRYQNAMTWMFMGLDDPNHMTRWEKFRVSILDVSPVMNSMKDVKEEVRRYSGGNKYGFINYHYCEFNNLGDVSRFHIEARGMDNIPCPSIVAAVACMYYALAIKAVELSRYGILNVGDDGWLIQAKNIKNCMLNNMKDYTAGDRFSDTSKLEMYYDTLRDEAMDLLFQLKHILERVGPAFGVLEHIANLPVSFRRIDGKTWEDIEHTVGVRKTEEDDVQRVIDEYIDLRYITKCNDLNQWIINTADVLETDYRLKNNNKDMRMRVSRYVHYLKDCGSILWSGKIGAAVKM